jgi:hypothetical protein
VLAGTLLAQVPTGSIAGTVLDPQGLPIADAEVTIINEGTGTRHTVKTSRTGAYLVPSLQAGLYTVEVAVSGFRTAATTGLKLNAGTQYSVPPVQLELGKLEETVTVEGGAELVQTTTTVISNTVEERQIKDLPIQDRNPVNLIALQAGVAQNGRSNTTINGMRSSGTNMTIDGINVQDLFIKTSAIFSPNTPRISGVGEFTVMNANSGANVGLGANQINMITPTGTNEYHGEAFWYHRNAKFAANDWFANAESQEKAKLVHNQGGFNLGGPILHDKLFGYGWYELFRVAQSDSTRGTVLTSTARQGLFRYTTGADIDTGVNPLPGYASCESAAAVIPSGTVCQVDILAARGPIGPFTIDPFIAGLLAGLPTEINTFAVGDSSSSLLLNTAGFGFTQSEGETRDQWGLKIDFVPNVRHSVAVSYHWNTREDERPDIDSTFNTTPTITSGGDTNFLSATYRWTPSPRFTNEFRFGFNLAGVLFDNTFEFGDFMIDDADTIFSPVIDEFRDQGRDTDVYTAQYNGAYTWGTHNLNFGYQGQFIRTVPFTGFDVPPTVNIGLSSANTNGWLSADFPGGASSSERSRANDLFETLVGFMSSAVAEFNVTSRDSGFVVGAVNSRNYRHDSLSFYFSDSWRMYPRFTLNYGIRWEDVGRLCEVNGLHLIHDYSPNTGAAARAAMATDGTYDWAGQCGSGRQFYNRDLNNWAPQLGFAWDVFGDAKTSLRGAYSLHFFNDEAVKAPINMLRQSSLGISGAAVVSDLTTTISQGVPTFTPPALQVPRTATDNFLEFGGGTNRQRFRGVNPDLKTPYALEWSLGIQREVGWNTVVDVSYRGNRANQLTSAFNLNQVNIFGNGFFEDFQRARANGFLCQDAGLGFDPQCALPGSQPLTLIPTFVSGGFLTSSSIRGRIERGEVGDLAYVYHDGVDTPLGFPIVGHNLLTEDAMWLTNHASSTYHAGVVEVRRRWSDGLYFQGNYTWSKVLSDSGGLEAQGQNNFDPPRDINQLDLDYARAAFDLTHAFKANFIYELPLGRGRRLSAGNWADKLIGGWNIGSIFTWQTGAPFSILSRRGTVSRALRNSDKGTAFVTGTIGDVDNLIGTFVTPDGVFWFDPNAIDSDGDVVNDDELVCVPFGAPGFCNPAPGTHGNLPLRAFDGPSYFNWDFTIIKKTPVTEKVSVEFRTEIFNLPNHPTFLVDDTGSDRRTNINSSTFGKMDDMLSDSRVIQFALRVIF